MVEINPLTKGIMDQHVKEFLLIDDSIQGEKWSRENFLFDLPEKWNLSLQVLSNQTLAGFLIASNKDNAFHIHRLAIGSDFQNQGLGRQLVERLQHIARTRKVKLITLKVLNTNTDAIRFYERIGFVLKQREKQNVWMELNMNE